MSPPDAAALGLEAETEPPLCEAALLDAPACKLPGLFAESAAQKPADTDSLQGAAEKAPSDMFDALGEHLELVGHLLRMEQQHPQQQQRQSGDGAPSRRDSGATSQAGRATETAAPHRAAPCAEVRRAHRLDKAALHQSTSRLLWALHQAPGAAMLAPPARWPIPLVTEGAQDRVAAGVAAGFVSETPSWLQEAPAGRTVSDAAGTPKGAGSLGGVAVAKTKSSQESTPDLTSSAKLARRMRSLSADMLHVQSMEEIEGQCQMRPSVGRHPVNILDTGSCLNACRRRCAMVMQSSPAEWLVSIVIFLNAICIGVQADWAVQNPGQPLPSYFETLDLGMLGFFTVELAMRIISAGSDFCNPRLQDFKWNVFDTLLVATTYFELLLTATGVSAIKTSFTRLLRLSRLVRAVRVVRIVRFFSELRVMVIAIGSSLRLLLWASTLLLMLMYLFAVCFLQIAEEQFVDARNNPTSAADGVESLKVHWGSLPSGVYTLFLSITGGISWKDAVDPLTTISPFLAPAYCVFISVAVFCVLNTITGIFVEKANQITAVDEDCRLWNEMDKRRRWIREVKLVFQKADVNQTGVVDWEGFSECMKDTQIQQHLKALGVDVIATDPRTLFELFDVDGGGTIEIAEFATGLQRLHGEAKAVDVARLKLNMETSHEQLNQIKQMLEHAGMSAPGKRPVKRGAAR